MSVLDGWRAVSILLVLAGHLLPLGPSRWEMNEAVAAMGMVIFFTLSGFLITSFLSRGADLRVFIIRRFFRIAPLAWVVMIVLLIMNQSPAKAWVANLLFYANLPPYYLVPGGGHLWSLCVEVQFYLGITLFVMIARHRGLILLPLITLGITLLRIVDHQYINIITASISPYWLLPLVLLSAHPAAGILNYARPYLAAALVGATLFNGPVRLGHLLESRPARYIAEISYALYIFHGALNAGWLGSGSKVVKYAKRPLLLAVTFALAHVSTFRFEQPCIALAKRLTRGVAIKAPA
ncbi:MAG: acyltransferase [Oxalobacteraceae bacterium]|nr:MAG: acyltransferase [Oxalobacteraceae bacterium]